MIRKLKLTHKKATTCTKDRTLCSAKKVKKKFDEKRGYLDSTMTKCISLELSRND